LSIMVDDNTVLFNDGADVEFSMQDVKPSDVLVIAGQLRETQQTDGDDSGHLVVFCTPEQDEILSHDWIALRTELHSVDVNVLPDGILPKLAVTVAAGHGINLLQASYGKKLEYGLLLRPWKVAALLLLGLVVVGMAMKGVGYYQLLQDEATLRAQFNAEYRLLRPQDSRKIIDPVATVESLRRGAGSSAAPQVFLPGLRELGAALDANSGAEIEAINYRAGVIDLRLTAPDVATLDKIQKAVSASGRFRASIQSTDQVADKTNGRIQIRETGT
jgi:general secretion pathway protein L